MCESERVLESLFAMEEGKRVILRRGGSGNDMLGNFPSFVVGVGDSESEPILVLKASMSKTKNGDLCKYIDDKVLRKVNWWLLPGMKGEVRNVGSEKRGRFDEVKVCNERVVFWKSVKR